MDITQSEQVRLLEKKANILRRHVLTVIGTGKAGHLGGSNSAADIVAALYFCIMNYKPDEPSWKDRDRFVLSKGHAALVQYAALAELGVIPMDELKKAKSLGAMLQGHPDMSKTPGIEAGTGSLGQGLSIGVGMALGLRLDKNPARVFVMLGDGELAEGQIWEAAMAAAVYGLDKLIVIVDKNNIQATGPVAERFDYGQVIEKWEAFGWNTSETDGHDMARILEAFKNLKENGKPSVIIARTVKGKGVSFAENTAAFHNGIMTPEQFEEAKQQLYSGKEGVNEHFDG